jgi:hypothetical protein
MVTGCLSWDFCGVLLRTVLGVLEMRWEKMELLVVDVQVVKWIDGG